VRADHKARLARLENRDAQGRTLARVVYLRPDGLPEDPADYDTEGPIICFPRKSATPEQWMEECRVRFQHRDEWLARHQEEAP
jgi:hypothetical protein